ncbi:MAG: (d)CMP kinase [Bacteroidales bacterium]
MSNNRLITIAIDGFSSSGKSSMAKALARKIGYKYIDSGAMYRAVTLYAQDNGLIDAAQVVDVDALKAQISDINIAFKVNAETGVSETYLNNQCVEQQIREMRVSNSVSVISAIPFVREALVAQQQCFGEDKGIVMDGRDIGTVVFPDAEMKIFVNASAEKRAMRRYKELEAKGVEVIYEDVLKNVTERDYLDQNRAESPLRQAEDAILLDNSSMSIDQQNEWLIAKFTDIVSQ